MYQKEKRGRGDWFYAGETEVWLGKHWESGMMMSHGGAGSECVVRARSGRGGRYAGGGER